MKKYLLTSTAFTGEVEFNFNDSGMLNSFDASRADLSAKQQEWILKAMPDRLSEVQRVLGDSKTATLTEIKEEVTFEMFWNKYFVKGSFMKRPRALSKWNRMSKAEQFKAYKFITKYEQNIPHGISKMYAETYLNSEIWNN